MSNKSTRPILIIAGLLCAASAHAQLYKSVGPDGRITYSDTPPAAAKRVEQKALGGSGSDTGNLPYALAEAVKTSPVTLFSSAKCLPCDDGRTLLKNRGIPFAEKTVNNNDDLIKLRQAGGEGQLPMLLVGRSKLSGYEAGAWSSALTAAGYPASSQLPNTYQNPRAEAAAPVVAADPTKSANPSDHQPERPAASPKTAEPGFRF
ncbi:glutaredoxin family protein [Undibacterium arcticum]|uniref:Glutaredoxin family protein n=1 Tax=Undibacterium arcticum TaxID=1762892 RepID=A0ABV7EZC1_9BURK